MSLAVCPAGRGANCTCTTYTSSPATSSAALGQGMLLLREHFAHYRPLVAATALGVAAAVHDLVASAS